MKPRTARRIHLALMVFWAAQMVAVAVLYWPWDRLTYLIELSLAALLVGQAAGLSAERPSETIE